MISYCLACIVFESSIGINTRIIGAMARDLEATSVSYNRPPNYTSSHAATTDDHTSEIDGPATIVIMEPPLKRSRLFRSNDPDTDLHERRARNDSRLKSIFESIFDKYGKDFEGVGDEIDMRTGEIVVNNGHILGMIDERDAGDAESSSEELESGYYSEDEDPETPISSYEHHEIAQKLDDSGDEALTAKPEASWRSDDDADSLMGAIEAEQPSVETDSISRVEDIVSDPGEDELANSDFEWMTPRHIRAVAQDRWRHRKLELESLDDSTIEPAWRAPSISKARPSSQEILDTRMTSIDEVQDDPDSEGQGVSLWAPEGKKRRRLRSRKSHAPDRQSPLIRQEGFDARESLSDSSISGHVFRKYYWTQEEEDLLRQLKTTTTLTCREMQPYFPHRHGQSISLHWFAMNNRQKANPKLKASGRTNSKPLSPSTTSFRVQKRDSKMTNRHETSDSLSDTQRIDFLLKTVDPTLTDQTIGTDKPTDELFHEYMIQPNESIKRADILGNVAWNQSTLNAVQPSLKNNPILEKERHKCFNNAAAASSQNVFGTGNEDSFPTLPVVQGTPQPASPIIINSPICQVDEEVSQLIVEKSKEENAQTEIFMLESERAIESAAAVVRGRRDKNGAIGQAKSEDHEQILSTFATQRKSESDAAIRRRRCAQRLAKEGSEIVSQSDDRHGGPEQGQAIKTEIKLSPTFEDFADDTSHCLQTASVAISEIRSTLQNPADTPTPLVQEITDSLPVEYSPREKQSIARRAASTEIDVASGQLGVDSLRPVTTEHVFQVLIPVPKSYAVSNELTKSRNVTIDEWRPDLEDQSKESKSPNRETLKQSPPKCSSPAARKDRPAVLTPKLHIDNINTRNVECDRVQCDTEDPLGSEIPDSQPSSKTTPTSRTPGSQDKKAKRSASIVPPPSSRGRHSSLRLPKKQKKSKLTINIAESFSSISEAMLDCSEDELSFM